MTKYIAVLLFATLVFSSCSEGKDELDLPTHSLEPSDEMISLAKQQCNDSDKDQGVVELKDSTTGEIVSRAVVNCD